MLFDNIKGKIQEFSWVLLGQVLLILMSFVSIRLLTLMSEFEFGFYSLILVFVSLVSAILYGPAEQAFIRFYFDFKKADLLEVYLTKLIKFIFLSTLLILFFVTFIILIHEYAFLSLPGMHYFVYFDYLNFALFVIINSSSLLLNSIFNSVRERKLNTLISLAEKISILASLLFVKEVFGMQIGLVFLALNSVALVYFLLKIYLLKKKLAYSFREKNISIVNDLGSQITKRMFAFSLPFILWGFTGWLQTNSDKWIISNVLSLEELGLYSLLFSFVNYLIVIPSGLVAQFMQPIIYEKLLISGDPIQHSLGYRILNYCIGLVLLLSIIFSFLTFEWGGIAIQLLSSKSYIFDRRLLPILCFASGLFQIGQFLTTRGMVLDKPKAYLPVKIVIGIIALLLNYCFASLYGLIGITVSLFITSLIYVILVILSNKYYIKRLV